MVVEVATIASECGVIVHNHVSLRPWRMSSFSAKVHVSNSSLSLFPVADRRYGTGGYGISSTIYVRAGRYFGVDAKPREWALPPLRSKSPGTRRESGGMDTCICS